MLSSTSKPVEKDIQHLLKSIKKIDLLTESFVCWKNHLNMLESWKGSAQVKVHSN